MQLLGLNKLQPHEIKSYEHKIGVESDVSRSGRGQVAGRKMDPCSTVAYERRSRNATCCYPGGVLSVDSSRATRPVVTIWCCGCVQLLGQRLSVVGQTLSNYYNVGPCPAVTITYDMFTTTTRIRFDCNSTALRPLRPGCCTAC